MLVKHLQCWALTLVIALIFLGIKPATALECRSLLFTEYCLENGSIELLMPTKALESYFAEEADQLERVDRAPSKLSDIEKAKIQQMWKIAVRDAYQYANDHSLRLSHIEGSTLEQNNGTGIINQLGQFASMGTILRFTFRKNSKNVYRLSKPAEFNRKRVLTVMRNMIGSTPSEWQFMVFPIMSLLASVPAQGDYVEINKVLNSQLLTALLLKNKNAPAGIENILTSIMGWEVMVGFIMEFEERIFERNQSLNHDVMFYRRATSDDETGSPQVDFNGQLFIPDSFVHFLDDEQLQLILRHEAMHLAKPNFFTVASVADSVLRTRFPQLSIDKTTPWIANFFGRPTPKITLNCPFIIPYDDELFTDYYTLFQLRNEPEKIDAFEQLLKKLRDRFDPGDLSRMSFRVRQIGYVRTRISEVKAGGFDIERQNELFTLAIQNAIPKMIAKHFSGKVPNLNDMLLELERYPEIRSDAQLIRLFFEYYKTYADSLELPGHKPVAGMGLTCENFGKMVSILEY